MTSYPEYLAKLTNDTHRQRLAEVIDWAVSAAPDLLLEMKWNQPMLTHNSTFILGFSAAAQHFSVAPEPVVLEEFRDALDEAGYSHSKALFRIRWNQEVNYKLLQELIDRSVEFKQGSTTFWAK